MTVSVIYEHDDVEGSLKTFDRVFETHPYVKELSFPLIDENANYKNRKYSERDMFEYRKRLEKVKDLTRIKIEYNDGTDEIVNQHYFITDEKNKCFKRWFCNAGIDFRFVYFNGDICPCDGYRNVKLGSLCSDSIGDFNLDNKKIFCKVNSCPCVFDVYKKTIFEKK